MSEQRINALEHQAENLEDTLKYLARVVATVEERLESIEEHLLEQDGYEPPELADDL